MARDEEKRIFSEYLAAQDLRHSSQREEILDLFLSVDKHLTANELYIMAQKKNPAIGFATVYRTLKLLRESGLCRELKFEDGTSRYEHEYGHRHHDHIICTKCGRCEEVVEPEIEKLQEKLFKEYGFYPERHRMELYGVCKRCKK